MKLYLPLILFCATASLTSVSAQTLQDTLIAEDPAKLVQQARQGGDVIRGAILFHQGNINCAKCHRAAAGQEMIGPDLSRMEPDATDESIVESILQPSKQIKKGYATSKVLTDDGRLIVGVITSQDNDRLVIRDIANPDRLITVSAKDVDEVSPSAISSMPDGLVNELKDRRQFLDLLRYVLDVKERPPASQIDSHLKSETGGHHAAITSDNRRELSPQLSGLGLIQQHNCVACHSSPTAGSFIAAKQAPMLKWSAKWLNPGYLVNFIADPHSAKSDSMKSGSTMPNMLADLDESSRQETAKAISHYLVRMAGSEFASQGKATKADAVGRGRELFHSIGCVACHSPRDKMANETGLADSVPLGPLTPKYGFQGLVQFLEDPHSVRPSGRMPNMTLSHFEAEDLASYLLQDQAALADAASTQSNEAAWQVDDQLAARGQALFAKHNCAACHTNVVNGLADSTVGANAAATRSMALAELDPDRGCLSDKVGHWPQYQLDPQDKSNIQAALRDFPVTLTRDQRIDLTLVTFNCVACHQRDELGGVTELRNPHFQTTNMNLGDQGRIPPALTGVGAKLKPKWMRDVLVKGRVIRPYMKTRMPQYGENNVGHLVDLFQASDQLPATEFPVLGAPKEVRKQGLEIAGNKGLNCVACHTYQYKLSDTMPAVDLTEMTARLKKNWFHQYMLDPQRFSPNTVMPSFWPGGVAIREDIAGDAPMQVEALWQYLLDGRQARAPSGVVREPLEIVVDSETQMLRRSYQGIGKRGIGVGYPGGVNLAFDAQQMRLAMIWRGKFVDPAAVWTGQGSGTVRPLGPPIRFAMGPDLGDAATLSPGNVDGQSAAGESAAGENDSRPVDHQFKGYRLDQQRSPTFEYQFQDVRVDDFATPFTDTASSLAQLRRRVKLVAASDHKGLAFRIASGQAISKLRDGVFQIDERLQVHLSADQTTRIVDGGDGKQLQVLMDLTASEPMMWVVEYRWQ